MKVIAALLLFFSLVSPVSAQYFGTTIYPAPMSAFGKGNSTSASYNTSETYGILDTASTSPVIYFEVNGSNSTAFSFVAVFSPQLLHADYSTYTTNFDIDWVSGSCNVTQAYLRSDAVGNYNRTGLTGAGTPTTYTSDQTNQIVSTAYTGSGTGRRSGYGIAITPTSSTGCEAIITINSVTVNNTFALLNQNTLSTTTLYTMVNALGGSQSSASSGGGGSVEIDLDPLYLAFGFLIFIMAIIAWGTIIRKN